VPQTDVQLKCADPGIGRSAHRFCSRWARGSPL